MKILVISHEYPPLGGGGGKVVEELCLGLASRGHQIHILTAHFENLPKKETKENLTIERLPSWRTQAFRADLKAMGVFVCKSALRGIRIARSWKPDLIHAHFAVPAGASAYQISKRTGIPYVLTAHGGDVPGGAPEKTDRWFRFALPFSKQIWKHARSAAAVSRQTRDLALAHYRKEIRIIPNGIDTKACIPKSLQPHDPPRILFIGRFSPEKNAAAVPKILSLVRELDWDCAMLGDGLQMEATRQLLEKNHLLERVELTGWVEPGEILDWMVRSDILLMPSLREAMPMAGLQGLSMGLALVLSDIGGCPDLAKENVNGFLVIPGDIEGYSQALKKLLKDRGLLARFRANSRQRANEFGIDKMIDQYEDFYQQAARGG